MKKLQDIDESKMVINPFSYTLQVEATKLIDSRTVVSTPGYGYVTIETETLIEHKSYTKLFYCSGCKDIIYNLSSQGKSLYLFVLYNLTAGRDWMQLNSQWYMTKNNIKSINTFKDAVKELCRYAFLSQSADYNDVYWINPSLFFHGSRIKKYPSNVVVKNTRAV